MRDLKSELEVKEAKHFKRKAGDVFEGKLHLGLSGPRSLTNSTSMFSLPPTGS